MFAELSAAGPAPVCQIDPDPPVGRLEMTPRETKLEAALDANAALRVQAERPQAPSHDADAFMADIVAKRCLRWARPVVA